MKEFDTICAIATALGEGGIAIIRISGDKSLDIISKIFKPKSKIDIKQMKSYTMKYGHIYDPQSDELIDEVIISYMKGPRSFTAEDTIEINCHGGVVSTNKVLETVIKAGARLAEPGEFTKRAFLNGRIDLSQAEAVMDIITAKTDLAMKSALMQSTGHLSREINRLREYMLNVLALVEFAVDFTEDDEEVDPSIPLKVGESLEKAINEMNVLLKGADEGKLIREGLSLAIVGKPNVGKSSLLNALLREKRAIVTDIAGTTRDVLKETLDLGIPVTLVDTAGIRGESDDKVEAIGIEYSKQSLNEADLVLFVYDSTQGIQKEDQEIYDLVKDKNHIVIANKCDICTELEEDKVYLSALTGEGVQELKQTLTNKVCDIEPESLEFVTNSRQQTCLSRARASLDQALLAASIQELQDLISIDVKASLLALDELTGELITDDILDNIFDHFCIGK